MEIAVGISALFISITTVVFSAIQFKYVAKTAYVDSLEKRCDKHELRLAALEAEVAACEAHRLVLVQKNYAMTLEVATLRASAVVEKAGFVAEQAKVAVAAISPAIQVEKPCPQIGD